jgi:hypothetical protein
MSLSDIASVATVISSLAVLVSLVYLSLQIRQTEKNQRALTDQGTSTRNIDILMFHAQPELNALTTRVTTGDTEFTAEELNLLNLRLRTTMLTGQDNLVQHKAGLLDRITVENNTAVLRFVLAQPVYRALWFGTRRGYSSEWREHVDKLLTDLPLARPADPVAAFKADLARVKASEPEVSPPP